MDGAGRPVMAGQHPRGDLAPRDVVAAVMQRRMERGDGPADHLWLDATGLGRAVLERDFPTVTAACRQRGIDPVAEPIPVAPGAHYACGGIEADMDGRTSVAGLFAVGEAASTGVHGANRLASNSLTEALIAGRRAGDLLGRSLPRPAGRGRRQPAAPARGPRARARPARPALASAMSRHAGVVRDAGGLGGAAADAGAGAGRQAVAWTSPRPRRPACTRSRSWSPCPAWPGRRAAGATGGGTCPPPRIRGARHTVLRVDEGRPRAAPMSWRAPGRATGASEEPGRRAGNAA